MKLILSESEKLEIRKLYENAPTNVNSVKLNNSAISKLPDVFVKNITDSMLKNKTLADKVSKSFGGNLTNNPLDFLLSKGIEPYLYVDPDYSNPTVQGTPILGLSFKINNTPFTINLDLGTNPTKILNSLKYSQIGLTIPF